MSNRRKPGLYTFDSQPASERCFTNLLSKQVESKRISSLENYFLLSSDDSDRRRFAISAFTLDSVVTKTQGSGGLRSLRIGVRLLVCFTAIVALMIAGALVAVRQMQFLQSQVHQMDVTDQQVMSILHVNNSVMRFKLIVQDTAAKEDAAQLKAVIDPFRDAFTHDVDIALLALRATNARQDRSATTNILAYYRLTVPEEASNLTGLAELGDWQAVRLRVQNQVSMKSRVLSEISANIDADSRRNRALSLARMASLQQNAYSVWVLFCTFIVVAACLLAWLVTRSITRPLHHLESGAQALARGGLDCRIEVGGRDELTVLASAFNQAASSVADSHALLDRRVAERTAQLERATDAAEEASRSKGEFLANMSHEIRTPMNGILGMTDLALATTLTGEQRDFLTAVKSSGESLLIVVNDILDFSRIEAGKLAIELAPCNLRETVNDLSWPLAMQARLKGLQFTCEFGHGVPELVCVDRDRIRQVLTNLLGNALKFTAEGRIGLQVYMGDNLDSGECALRFSVSDTGIGIAREKQSSIFEAFTQADGSVTRTFGGTGLGLAICRRLVSLMGGVLVVESKLGEGSRFSFTLPCEVVAESRTQGTPEMMKETSPSPPSVKLNILLAEDNPVNRKVASSLIEKQGHSVTCVADGLFALEAFRQNTYDLIFMDLQMPRMGGLEATGCIREEESKAGREPTSIIALTAHAMKGDRERCLQAGMDDYLSKPLRTEELRSKLLRWSGPDRPERDSFKPVGTDDQLRDMFSQSSSQGLDDVA